MSEHTITIEVDGLADPRLEDLDDLFDLLDRQEHLLGPALAGNLATGSLSLIVTVESRDEHEAYLLASVALTAALVLTHRAESVARVMPAAVAA